MKKLSRLPLTAPIRASSKVTFSLLKTLHPILPLKTLLKYLKVTSIFCTVMFSLWNSTQRAGFILNSRIYHISLMAATPYIKVSLKKLKTMILVKGEKSERWTVSTLITHINVSNSFVSSWCFHQSRKTTRALGVARPNQLSALKPWSTLVTRPQQIP
jgi:hypothetical protein